MFKQHKAPKKSMMVKTIVSHKGNIKKAKPMNDLGFVDSKGGIGGGMSGSGNPGDSESAE